MINLTRGDVEILRSLVKSAFDPSPMREELLGRLASMQPRPERLSAESESLLCDAAGLEDQIEKQHWLNVHFRAFELAHRAWQEHVKANARGAKAIGL